MAFVEPILALPDDEVNSLLINFFGILKAYQESMRTILTKN